MLPGSHRKSSVVEYFSIWQCRMIFSRPMFLNLSNKTGCFSDKSQHITCNLLRRSPWIQLYTVIPLLRTIIFTCIASSVHPFCKLQCAVSTKPQRLLIIRVALFPHLITLVISLMWVNQLLETLTTNHGRIKSDQSGGGRQTMKRVHLQSFVSIFYFLVRWVLVAEIL